MTVSTGNLIGCFAPVANCNATALILGSMPGKESLKQNRYYAHPQNAFWKIMGELVGAHPHLPFEERLRNLIELLANRLRLAKALTKSPVMRTTAFLRFNNPKRPASRSF